MVLLTYQDDETLPRKKVLPDSVSKNECPKTAYIDKLNEFNEEYADEERCDLFFICQDGEIPAHRLVISNASKYIMAMQDDQPPWYPVYISVPDLTKEMVNTLVRLAYTGQMNIPQGITSDELLDAMQALGWVHTDCLTATYLDSSSASNDDDFGFSVTSKTGKSLETVLKMNLPVGAKGDTDTSDDEMEMVLPDVPLSDEDDGKLGNANESTEKKGISKRTRQAKQTKNKTPSKSKPVASEKRSPSPKHIVNTTKQSESPSSTRKGSRKNIDDTVNTSVSNDKKPEVAPNSNSVDNDAVAEPLRSRTRTIRKPKKFDDAIVLTPTKRKDSPTKSPSKPTPKSTTKTNAAEKETKEITVSPSPRKGIVTKKATNDINPGAAGSKSRRSTSSDSKDSPRNSLITSYFNKRSPRKSNDVASQETAKSQEDGGNAEANNVQNDSDADPNKDITDDTDDKDVETNKKDKSNNTTTSRKRARSTASSKGEKEAPQDDAEADTETSAKTRRKKNILDNSEIEAVETLNPLKRGRKASTLSTTSKSSNKDVTEQVQENELDDGIVETPRKRRSRQE